jgi:hypothetical protein
MAHLATSLDHSASSQASGLIGMAASGAKYGTVTSHFYWVGRSRHDDLQPRGLIFEGELWTHREV